MTREIKDGYVIITHDDGSVVKTKLPSKPSKRDFDADYSKEDVAGHVFEEAKQ